MFAAIVVIILCNGGSISSKIIPLIIYVCILLLRSIIRLLFSIALLALLVCFLKHSALCYVRIYISCSNWLIDCWKKENIDPAYKKSVSNVKKNFICKLDLDVIRASQVVDWIWAWMLLNLAIHVTVVDVLEFCSCSYFNLLFVTFVSSILDRFDSPVLSRNFYFFCITHICWTHRYELILCTILFCFCNYFQTSFKLFYAFGLMFFFVVASFAMFPRSLFTAIYVQELSFIWWYMFPVSNIILHITFRH